MAAQEILKAPPSPWEAIVLKFFGGEAPEAPVFSQKHHLPEAEVEQVFSGQETRLSPELCVALSRDTGMSVEFFSNLSANYHRGMGL